MECRSQGWQADTAAQCRHRGSDIGIYDLLCQPGAQPNTAEYLLHLSAISTCADAQELLDIFERLEYKVLYTAE